MASLPTGSDKVLEIHSENVCVVIKSKKRMSDFVNKSIALQESELRVMGNAVKRIKVLGDDKYVSGENMPFAAHYTIPTCPLFFEQTDYELLVRSNDGKVVSLWHENYNVRSSVDYVTESKDLISGMINFGNNVGFSEFEVLHDEKKVLVIRIEVFPSKISYKEDYANMLRDISNEISGVVLDFMRSTYREMSIGAAGYTVPVLYFEIIRQIFGRFQNAINTITASPYHKLYTEHTIQAAHKIKRVDRYTMKWLQKHPEQIALQRGTVFEPVKAPSAKKHVTYNTTENRFVKFMLKATVRRLVDFHGRYMRSTPKPERSVIEHVNHMINALNNYITKSFLKEVDDYKSEQSMSLVFEMAPGYRELYKYYLMLQRSLSVHGDVFRLSLKDTAQLYEYWCFIKLVSLMKRSYRLVSSDVIKVDCSGVTVNLTKGKKSEVRFVNPRSGEIITLTYNPGMQNTQTVNQKPDNVLTLEKRGTSVPYKYVFDAKYRIESNPQDPFYPDNRPGPKVSDINTMHRYRDAIVYENDTPSRFMFEKTMFGAYVLFPYHDPDGEYKNHRFFRSIETVNIGGLPFLPGTTRLLENFLRELVDDSSETAFERASLPRGIEDKLAKVDWSVKDVMVGTVRTDEQLQFNIENRGYYVPAKFISEEQLPIRYIALHEEKIGTEPGIKRYGEVLTAQKIQRGKIPVSMRKNADPKELYYYFTVRSWMNLPQRILIEDSFRGKPKFTNKFLLDHCERSYQLFSIGSEEEYRLMSEISKAFDRLEASSGADNTAVYRVNDQCSVIVTNGFFTISDNQGEILDRIAIAEFTCSPRAGFRRIKEALTIGC